MSFLKSLFSKGSSKNSDCCDIKIVEVKDENAATAASTAQTNQASQK